MHTHLTATLFFSNNKKKYLTPSYKYRVINYYLEYNKALYKLFKILITKFTIKYSISPENTNTSPKGTNISPKGTNTSFINL